MKFSISPRMALLIITAMFLFPLTLAWMMYSGSVDFQPASARNLGTLIEPPFPLDWRAAIAAESSAPVATSEWAEPGSLAEHWVILHPVHAPCETPCRQQVTSLRQIHLATGRHQPRLRVALLLDENVKGETTDLLKAIYGKFALIRDPGGTLRDSLASVRPARAGQSGTGHESPGSGNAVDGIYLIDPLGNIMMYYAADADPNDIRQDLKRLLTWSKLDEQ